MKTVFKIFIISGIIFLCGLRYCYLNYRFWTHYKTDNFESLIEYKGKNIKGLRGKQILIHKDFEKDLQKIDDYASKNNINLIVNHSYRPDKYALSGAIVKPVKTSNHHAGFAIDFNIIENGIKYFSNDLKRKNFRKLPSNIQNFINDIRKNRDLRWGGDFRREDPVHIDHPKNIKSKVSWENYSKNCSEDYLKRIPIWKF